MNLVSIRKLNKSDKKYFARWWRDKDLIALTSGNFKLISDEEIESYFSNILIDETSFHYIISLNKKAIGHISLSKRRNDWYELQTIIGEKQFQSKGYGTKAIKLLIKKAKLLNIHKIYLEVQPDNSRAIKTYEKSNFAFKRIKYYPKNKNLPKTIRMELIINPI
jgi:RimJ/RimL family protein N-acetyltransferase